MILYVGRVVSPAVICMLVVYCFRNVSILSGSHGIPELLSALLCVLLQRWKHNPLLSILISTALYMFLIQKVFL